MVAACAQVIQEAAAHHVNIIMPIDYVVARASFDGPLSTIESDTIPDGLVGIAIGPKTAAIYAQEIMKAQTIFFSGLMGSLKRKETLASIRTIFDAMAKSHGFRVIGGGDSVGAAIELGFETKFDFLSTCGGATLTYLSGQPLVGLSLNLMNRAET